MTLIDRLIRTQDDRERFSVWMCITDITAVLAIGAACIMAVIVGVYLLGQP